MENDFLVYEGLLRTSEEVRDPLWKEILPLYRSMNREQDVAFLQFLRVIQVNTVSHILGILDGVTYLNEDRETFALIAEHAGRKINGDLQDIFLGMEEV
ncbi:hypothetical protein [Pararcticibacter amylolyticus]|uniref:Uncharacterized protein n=1 Tax=Pararcticibacter amylolyticus TaxID=2173175 RepID=A0A2U2PDV8_9SPHI|nr:hypothetical protein [Pararcticibacter amylolyticus]PWG79540.1 hypothetical protein DDR33_15830 [Pararcticibacter amylolyticus]